MGFHIGDPEADEDALTELGALQLDSVIVTAAQMARAFNWQLDMMEMGEEVDVPAVVALKGYLERG